MKPAQQRVDKPAGEVFAQFVSAFYERDDAEFMALARELGEATEEVLVASGLLVDGIQALVRGVRAYVRAGWRQNRAAWRMRPMLVTMLGRRRWAKAN